MPFRKLICAPGKDGKYTCYNKDALLKMRDIWNKRHSNDTITTSNNCRKIWREIKNKVQTWLYGQLIIIEPQRNRNRKHEGGQR